MHILVVEDEPKVAQAIALSLRTEGYRVTLAHNGEDGFYLLNEHIFDAVILDLMLPGRDGLQILGTVRKRGLSTPVLILTAKDGVDDRVRGLDTGADDYLVKPFAFAELHARLRALTRRGKSEGGTRLSCADLALDLLARSAVRSGVNVALTVKEFELLQYLLRHQARVVSRDMLARDVWNEVARATPLDNVIDVHIARLRRKIDDPFATKLIHTVRGVGFVLRSEAK